MVGFPGEDDGAFERLAGFARAMRFEMAGVFRFSPEPGSRAAALPDRVPARVARGRERRLLAVLSEVAAASRARMIGQIHEAVVESAAGSARATGRLWFQGPEVDGSARISATRSAAGRLEPGRFLRVRITGAAGADFDAVAEGGPA